MKIFSSILFVAIFAASLQAQNFEHTLAWHNQSHSAWKIEPQSVQGYVIAGNKYFSAPNTDVYFSNFDEFGQFSWTRSHVSGLGSLQTFWKSFCKSGSPTGFFLASAGDQGGHKAYAILVNSYGMKFWDRVSPLPNGVEFGGACTATNGGYLACGGSFNGSSVTKFDAYGNVEWSNSYPGTGGFAWSIKPAVGGGYVVAGTGNVFKIDIFGNLEWSTSLNLPASPAPDGSLYTYTEFEEILPLPTNDGFIVTGSCFSNQFSGAYTARFTYSGGQVWSKVNETINTGGAGTPVNWVNNAVVNGSNEIVTSWRTGPVSAGGVMHFQKMTFAGANVGAIGSLGNTLPVREAFMSKAHGKYIVGGTSGNLATIYAYARDFLPVTAAQNDEMANLPLNAMTMLGRQVNLSNLTPEFERTPIVTTPGEILPTSRIFYTDLHVYPNPSTGWVNVGGELEPGAILRVTDMTGRVVLQQEIQEGDMLLNLDLSAQAKGMYNVEVIGKSGVMTKKLAVK